MIFESHAHYDDEDFNTDREELLLSLGDLGISHVLNVGASIETTKKTVQLTQEYPFIYGAAGVHPSETGELDEEKLNWLKEQCGLPKMVAVGEIGLDYYWDKPDKDTQKTWFEKQLCMAAKINLPVIIHSRDAAQDTLEILKAADTSAGGVIHCFSYGKEMAAEYAKLGFYFGIGGVITFKNAKKLKEAVSYLPIEKILLETDCPYLAPVPNRGKRNSSHNLIYIAEEIAAIKGMTREEVERITTENAKQLFRIKD